MYLPASASIASKHPELAEAIEAVDAVLYDIGDHPILPTVMADNLDVDEGTLRRILRQYEVAQVVRQENRWYCSRCNELVDENRDYCDLCDTRFETLRPEKALVFVVCEPILRVEFGSSTETPVEVCVLFVAGDRGGANENQVNIPDEWRDVKAALKAGPNAQFFQAADIIIGANVADLGNAYQQNPTVLHVAGHGNGRSLSLLERRGSTVSSKPLPQEQLRDILANYPERVLLCLLNACDSEAIADHLAKNNVVDIAIGWKGQPSDAIAIAFAKQFYGHLTHGLTIRQAFGLASATTCRPDSSVFPSLFAADGVDLTSYRLPQQRRT
jgi:hypothetical protein